MTGGCQGAVTTEELRGSAPPATPPTERADPSEWAIGFTAFAGCMMILLCAFQGMDGFATLLENELFTVTLNDVFALNLTN